MKEIEKVQIVAWRCGYCARVHQTKEQAARCPKRVLGLALDLDRAVEHQDEADEIRKDLECILAARKLTHRQVADLLPGVGSKKDVDRRVVRAWRLLGRLGLSVEDALEQKVYERTKAELRDLARVRRWGG